MEILIVKLSAIGDVIHTLPALAALHQQFPESNITWVVEEKAYDVIKDHPYLKRVVVSKRKGWLKNVKKPSLWYPTLKEIIKFIKELRSQNYDLVIDFQGLLKSALLILLSKGKRKVGYDKTREMSFLFLNEKIPACPQDQHAVEKNINLTRYLGAEIDEVRFIISIGEEDKRKIEYLLSENKLSTSKLLIIMSTQASWMTKIWDPSKVAKLSDRLIEKYDAQLVFTGGKDDYSSIEKILSLMNHRVVNASGKTSLKELAYLLSISDLMITMDSGPMHIASAMGTPTVALFGPTAHWRTGPYCNNAIIIGNHLPCSPCFKKRCDKGKACMEKISVGEILEAVDKQLKGAYKQ